MNEKLKAAREMRGWSIEQVSRNLDLHDKTSYPGWEHGTIKPNERNVKKLCSLFRLRREDLGL